MRLRSIHLFTILQVAIILTFCIIVNVYANDMQITEDMAIEIANKEVIKLGYSIGDMQVKATHYNTIFNEYTLDYEKIRKKLNNHGYWNIYYHNPKYTKGGCVNIFIDSNNGDFLDYIMGK